MKTLMPKVDTRDGLFHNGNPAIGEQGTQVKDVWLNNVQENLRDIQAEAHYVLRKAGFNPVENKQTQLYDSIVKIIGDNRKYATTKDKGEVKLNSAIDRESETEAATPKAVKAAYDKGTEAKTAADKAQGTANDGVSRANNAQVLANAAQRTANDGVSKAKAAQVSADAAQRTANDGVSKAKAAQVSADAAQQTANSANTNANSRVSKGGDTINGDLRINGQNGSWSKIQFGSKNSVWELEVHPESNKSINRRFNMKYLGDSAIYLSFPTIGDSGEIVAYRSWVEDRSTPWNKIDGKPAFATRWPNAVEQGYSHSLGRTGWTKLPSGLILQWGEVNGMGVHKFPIAFNSVGQVFVCERSYSDDGEIVVVRDVNNTSFRAWARRDMGAFLFFAIGS